MANPAELLYAQLTRWDQKGGQGKARRLDTDDGWKEQRQAVTNLENLVSLIDELERAGKPVEVEKDYLPRWTMAVFAYPNGWSHGDSFIQETTLQFLLLSAHRLADIVLPVRENAPQDMMAAAEELESDLKKRDDIPPALQMLVAESIGFLRNSVLEYDVTGEFILNKAVKKFAQILELLEETFPGETAAARLKFRVTRWYKSKPAQLALAGLISAEMALAAPIINDAAGNTLNSVEKMFEITEGETIVTPEGDKEEAEVIQGEVASEGEEEAKVIQGG